MPVTKADAAIDEKDFNFAPVTLTQKKALPIYQRLSMRTAQGHAPVCFLLQTFARRPSLKTRYKPSRGPGKELSHPQPTTNSRIRPL
jgi:hypothetical protein